MHDFRADKPRHSIFSNVLFFLKMMFKISPLLVIGECLRGVLTRLPTRIISVIGVKYVIDVIESGEDKRKIIVAVIVIALILLVTEVLNTLVLEPFYYCRDMVEIVHDDFNTTQWISSLLVLIVLLIAFRNPITALLAFLPMFLSWYVLQGLMALLGLEFNLINIVISTFIFGIGVDYSIFVMEGLLKEARTGQREMLEFHKVAIVFSALVLAIVVLSLIFARHPSIRSIGIITLIGMATTILLTYSLEPFLFRQCLKWGWYRKSIKALEP